MLAVEVHQKHLNPGIPLLFLGTLKKKSITTYSSRRGGMKTRLTSAAGEDEFRAIFG